MMTIILGIEIRHKLIPMIEKDFNPSIIDSFIKIWPIILMMTESLYDGYVSRLL